MPVPLRFRLTPKPFHSILKDSVQTHLRLVGRLGRFGFRAGKRKPELETKATATNCPIFASAAVSSGVHSARAGPARRWSSWVCGSNRGKRAGFRLALPRDQCRISVQTVPCGSPLLISAWILSKASVIGHSPGLACRSRPDKPFRPSAGHRRGSDAPCLETNFSFPPAACLDQ